MMERRMRALHGLAVLTAILACERPPDVFPAVQPAFVSPGSLDFGAVNIGMSKIASLPLRNNGTGPLEILSAEVATGLGVFVLDSAPARIEAAGEGLVMVKFTPPAVGDHSGTLLVKTNDASRAQAVVLLSGKGVDPLPGSWDLEFTDVVVDSQDPWTAPSQGRPIRLDLRAQGAGYEAVLTGRWGQPAAMAATVGPSSILLTGAVQVASFGTTDTWTELVLARDAEGRPAAPVRARGWLHFDGGDVFFQAGESAQGTVARDQIRPELHAVLESSRVAGGPLLPWDPLRIEAAEGVDGATLIAHTSLLRSGSPHPVSWALLPAPSGAEWAGATGALGRLADWDVGAGPFVAQVSAGVPDLAGHEADALTAPLELVNVGPPAWWHSFDGASIGAAAWGEVSLRADGSSAADQCEQGGCVQIGPFSSSLCAHTADGIAGRLMAPTDVATIHVRFRVLSGGNPQDPETEPEETVVLTAQAAVPTLAPAAASVSSPSYAQLDPPLGDLRWATEWTTADVALPSATTTAGFALHAGRRIRCFGGWPFGMTMVVLVDRIWAE